MNKNYVYHQDAGHGWIQVPLADLDALGIRNQISPYSYLRGAQAFLEEDCDASFFMKKAKEAGWVVGFTEKHHDCFAKPGRYPYNSEYNFEKMSAYLYG